MTLDTQIETLHEIDSSIDKVTANDPRVIPIMPVLIKVVYLTPPVTIFDFLPFILMFGIYCLIIHIVLMGLKKLYKPLYNWLVMFFIIAFPPITMFFLKDWIFICLWFALMIFFCYCIRIGFSKGLLAKENPKKIYNIFKKIFTITNFMMLISQVLIISSFVLFPKVLNFSLRCLVYSVYFAVFCREVMFNLSRIMGYTTGYYSKDDNIAASMEEDYSKCMICCENLINKKKIFTNTCGHSFHMECIKGWVLLANNFFCIYCKKGISDTDKLTKDLWYKTENTLRPLMNFLRSSISFFVVIYFFMLFRLK